MQLDRLQTRFVDEMLHGRGHMLLTGKAGTGKSTALISAVKASKACDMDVLVMAPTAMAASIHRDSGLESGTIHHALKWNPAKEPLPYKLLSVCGTHTEWLTEPDQNRILVVDEASMVGLWLFEILARDLGDPARPFDGRRLVLVGDWAQLPPVVGNDEQQSAKAMPELRNFGPPDGCVLYHRLFTTRAPTAVLLEETHRANSEWFEKLNLVRDCSRVQTLGQMGMRFPSVEGQTSDAVHLCFRRVTAHARNTERLARLGGREVPLMLRDGEMILKEGCEVIVTSNRAGGCYINGSRAKLAGVDDNGQVLLDDGVPIAMLADGNWGHNRKASKPTEAGDVEAGRWKAQRLLSRYHTVLEPDARKWLEGVLGKDGEETAARFAGGAVQFLPYWPILPGYAITVHKAQGATLESAIIEDDVFWNIAPARLPYVALSRVADESNLRLSGLSAFAARVRPDHAYGPILSRITKWGIVNEG